MLVFLAIFATAASGLQGVVHRGPTRPVCRPGEPCTQPAQVTLLFRRGVFRHGTLVSATGAPAVRARSGTKGHYRILLAPGYYTVTTAERVGIARNVKPGAVHVRLGHVDNLDFSIDTGIR